MFTGIVKTTGTVLSTKSRDGGMQFSIRCASLDREISEGESVSINGVCLTAEDVDDDILQFHAVPETINKTTLEHMDIGDILNVEPSLRVGDPLGGHFVLGHVEEVGRIEQIEEHGDGHLFTFSASTDVMKWVIPKGCVCVDGISLTPVETDENTFSVAVVPETLRRTNFSERKEFDRVNLEVDLLARYAAAETDVSTDEIPDPMNQERDN